MELNATYEFNAPVQEAWDLLMDTNAVAHCLPGCRGLRPIGDDRYAVELKVAIAAVAGDFKGTVALDEQQPPDSYKLVVEGSGSQGFVKGHAVVTLEADGDRTRVHVAAQADVGGKIARVGQRMLEGVARATMKRFYKCLAKQIHQPGAVYEEEDDGGESPPGDR
jgi:carbon monoxide dehydrogenase subunit G